MLKSSRKCEETDTRADFGQGWYQLIVQPEIRPGNLSARDLNFSPMGEKQRTTCRLELTLSRNQVRAFSLVGERHSSGGNLT